jgi:hypothetical protein
MLLPFWGFHQSGIEAAAGVPDKMYIAEKTLAEVDSGTDTERLFSHRQEQLGTVRPA